MSVVIPDCRYTFGPSARGRTHCASRTSLGVARLPEDALGTFSLTLLNMAAGSRYRIERAGDGSVATPSASAEGVAPGGSFVLTLDYYQSGSANNDLKIKARKGSASPLYRPYETQIVAAQGAQSVYIAQELDE